MTDALLLAERVAELVRIPSVNPLQSRDVAITGERRLAEHLANRAEALGADVVLDVVEDDRPNLYARFAGTSDEVLVVDVHLDTVAVEHMTVDPFDGRVAEGRVYGRGAVDTKATLALVLAVLEELRASGARPVPTVYVVGTIAEELGGLTGARRFAQWVGERELRIDRMVVGEPTLCAPVHGHKGAVGVEFTVHGHAAHSGYPELGRNAISAATRIVAALDAEQERLASGVPTTPVGCGTLAVTEIRGGLARNIVPDRCEVYVGRRLVPGEDPQAVFHQLSALAAGVATPCSVEARVADGLAFPAFYTPADDPFVERLTRLSGERPATAGYGTNCMAYGALAASTVVFGPGSIDQAHQAVEWVDVAELVRAADIYRQLLTAG